MTKVKKLFVGLRPIKHKSKYLIAGVVVVAAAAIIGTHLRYFSHAASPYVAVEAESGSLGGSATIETDSTASGGEAVKFGSGTTSQTCTDPSFVNSQLEGGETIGNYYVTNDMWNNSPTGTQTIYVCNYNNWYVTATQPATTSVKVYPNVHEDFSSEPLISSFSAITSSFAETAPHVGIYEYAYDMWLNGVATDGSTEVMIWTDNYNQTPSGTTQGTVTYDGQTYTIWKSGSYIAFVDNTNVTSGTVNILDFYNYIISKGWIPSTSTVGQIDYGIEVCSTNNAPATFAVNNFSITATQ